MPPVEKSAAALYVKKLISQNKIVIFSKTTCPWCAKVKELFKEINEEFVAIELDNIENGQEVKEYLIEQTKQSTVPNVFINATHVGGYDSTAKAQKEGTLAKLLAGNKKEESISLSQIVRPKPGQPPEPFVNELIKDNKVVIFSKTTCPFCTKVKELFKSLNESFTIVELDQIEAGPCIRDYLFEKTGQKTVPNVYVAGVHLGGCDNTLSAHAEGRLAKLLQPEGIKQTIEAEPDIKYDYDLIVIGGGSGGLACSKVK